MFELSIKDPPKIDRKGSYGQLLHLPPYSWPPQDLGTMTHWSYSVEGLGRKGSVEDLLAGLWFLSKYLCRADGEAKLCTIFLGGE